MTAITKTLRSHYIGMGVAFGIAAALGFAARRMYAYVQECNCARQIDAVRDKTLKDSFPASDPPASQFFDIPVNRQ
jgi:hypothetical protein